MTPDDHDTELRAHFSRLRDEDRATAGRYRAPSRPPHGIVQSHRVIATLGVAAGILVAALVLDPRRPPEQNDAPAVPVMLSPLTLGIGSVPRVPLQLAWRTPTDVLLDTPGSALLREVPDLGVSSLGSPARTARDSAKHARPVRKNARTQHDTSRSSS